LGSGIGTSIQKVERDLLVQLVDDGARLDAAVAPGRREVGSAARPFTSKCVAFASDAHAPSFITWTRSSGAAQPFSAASAARRDACTAPPR
jgi:hypothetical protein